MRGQIQFCEHIGFIACCANSTLWIQGQITSELNTMIEMRGSAQLSIASLHVFGPAKTNQSSKRSLGCKVIHNPYDSDMCFSCRELPQFDDFIGFAFRLKLFFYSRVSEVLTIYCDTCKTSRFVWELHMSFCLSPTIEPIGFQKGAAMSFWIQGTHVGFRYFQDILCRRWWNGNFQNQHRVIAPSQRGWNPKSATKVNGRWQQGLSDYHLGGELWMLWLLAIWGNVQLRADSSTLTFQDLWRKEGWMGC